jgi:protein tyrosine phosphatase (PTP) superfamily phosphohydrolase (DUF442 family)
VTDPRSPLQKIYNVLEIHERLLTSGQPTVEQLRAVAAAGYERVLNLLPDESDAYLPEEEELVRSLGLGYRRIPVRWSAPTRENFTEFCAEMQASAHCKLYVHCAANMRVSAFLYLWRVRCGEDEIEARADMTDIWTPDGVWAEFVASVRASL